MIYRIYSREEKSTVSTINGKLVDARKKAFYLILNGWDELLIQTVAKSGKTRTVGFMCRCEAEIGYVSRWKKKGGYMYYISLEGNLKHRYSHELRRHISWELVTEKDSAYMAKAYHSVSD